MTGDEKLAALKIFADPDNWERTTEYGPYGSYVVYVWTGSGCPIDIADSAIEGSNGTRTDSVLKLLDENDGLRGLLKRCEWSVHDDDYRNYCPICMEYQDDGHAPDCELAQALRGEG